MMRVIPFILIFLTSCKQPTELLLFATDGSDLIYFNHDSKITEFIEIIDPLDCQGFKTHAKVIGNIEEYNPFDFKIHASCRSSGVNKFSHRRAMDMRVYLCNVRNEFAFNLCENDSKSLKLFKEYYLNPKRRVDYPKQPSKAIFKLILDDDKTIQSLVEVLRQIQAMEDRIDNDILDNIPMQVTVTTTHLDSVSIPFPAQRNPKLETIN